MKNHEFINSIAYLKKRHIFAMAYLCLFVSFLSLYFGRGYMEIGADKYKVFRLFTLIGEPIWLIFAFIDVGWSNVCRSIKNHIFEWGIPEYAVLGFAVASLISVLTSRYMHTAMWGVDGWNMGFVTIALITGLYVIAYDLFRILNVGMVKNMIAIWMGVAAGVFVLGILNRFSIYPIHMMGEQEDFISTLGNINWYCGYWGLWAGLGFGIFIRSVTKRTRICAGIYIWLLAMAGVCCGASSCYVVWAGISLVSLLVALARAEDIIRWIYIQMIALSTLPCIRFIGLVRPYRMWYDSSWLKGVTYGSIWIVPFIVGMALCVLMLLLVRKISFDWKRLRGIIIGVVIGGLVGIIAIIYFNTVIPGGIWPVRGKTMFMWHMRWGNSRGGIWTATVDMIRHMPGFSMFFGVGCDCFYDYAYSCDSVKIYLEKVLVGTYLTNAHNEFMTLFINEGVVGVLCFGGILGTHIKKGIELIDRESIVYACALSVCAYIAFGVFGFANILSTPFLYMIMGALMGLAKQKGT